MSGRTRRPDRRHRSRRELLRSAGALGLAAALGPGFAHAVTPRGLKDIVRARTFDVEVHVAGPEWWSGPGLPPKRAYSREQLVADVTEMTWKEGEPGYEENIARLRKQREVTQHLDQARFLVGELDEAGIDTGCNLVIDHGFMPTNIDRKYKLDYERVLAEARASREAFPGRFITFGGVDPRRGGKDGAVLLRRLVKEHGCAGLGEQVLQQFDVFPDDRERCYPLYEVCVELDVPFYGNCEGPAPETLPLAYEQVARDFPKLRMCLAGAGRPRRANGAETREAAWKPVDDAIRLVATYENVYLDTADWCRRDAEGIRRYLTFLRKCFDGNARTKVMFATDYPVFIAMGSHRSWVDAVIDVQEKGLALSDEEIALFYSKNPMAFLKGAE